MQDIGPKKPNANKTSHQKRLERRAAERTGGRHPQGIVLPATNSRHEHGTNNGQRKLNDRKQTSEKIASGFLGAGFGSVLNHTSNSPYIWYFASFVTCVAAGLFVWKKGLRWYLGSFAAGVILFIAAWALCTQEVTKQKAADSQIENEQKESKANQKKTIDEVGELRRDVKRLTEERNRAEAELALEKYFADLKAHFPYGYALIGQNEQHSVVFGGNSSHTFKVDQGLMGSFKIEADKLLVSLPVSTLDLPSFRNTHIYGITIDVVRKAGAWNRGLVSFGSPEGSVAMEVFVLSAKEDRVVIAWGPVVDK